MTTEHPPRTITLEQTTIVVFDIRAWLVVAPPHPAYPLEDAPLTYVYLRDVPHPLIVRGTHTDALRAAVEGAL
jgi:hypothetical protein